MKVFVVFDEVLGGVECVCKTKEIAEREILKAIEYYNFPKSKWKPTRKNYSIKEMKVIE